MRRRLILLTFAAISTLAQAGAPASADERAAQMASCKEELDRDACAASGDALHAGWKTARDNMLLDSSINAYVTACFISRHNARLFRDTASVARADGDCKRATEVADAGAALGLHRATYNRGAIDHDIQRNDEALAWFKLAHERGSGLAAYSIGLMYEEGRGVKKNPDQAAVWFERGAALEEPLAIERMTEHWLKQIRSSFDPVLINRAMTELAKLKANEEFLIGPRARLAMLASITRNTTQFPELAKGQMNPVFCPTHVEMYESTWRIFGITHPDDLEQMVDWLTVVASGTATKKGCIKIGAADMVKIRAAMAKGHSLMLNWPGQRHLLKVERSAKGGATLTLGGSVAY